MTSLAGGGIFLFPLCHLYALTLLYVLNIREEVINGPWRGSARGMSDTIMDTTMRDRALFSQFIICKADPEFSRCNHVKFRGS